jgi:hypothetical protein
LCSQILEVRFQDEGEEEGEGEGEDSLDIDDDCDSYLYLAYGEYYDCALELKDEILHFEDVLKNMKENTP